MQGSSSTRSIALWEDFPCLNLVPGDLPAAPADLPGAESIPQGLQVLQALQTPVLPSSPGQDQQERSVLCLQPASPSHPIPKEFGPPHPPSPSPGVVFFPTGKALPVLFQPQIVGSGSGKAALRAPESPAGHKVHPDCEIQGTN